MRGFRHLAAWSALAAVLAVPAFGAGLCQCEERGPSAPLAAASGCHGEEAPAAPAKHPAPSGGDAHCAMACHAPAVLVGAAVLPAAAAALDRGSDAAPRPLAALPL